MARTATPNRVCILAAALILCCGEAPTGGPDSVLDTNSGDTTQPDTAQPDTAQPDTATPDTAQPATTQPDTTQPDTATPDTSTPKCKPDACPAAKTPCTANVCEPAIGCVEKIQPDGALCDDGDACTAPDSCTKGICSAGVDVLCDDKDPCTADSCVATSGQCAAKPQTGGTCDDGQSATVNDTCKAGKCVGEVLGCIDSAQCEALSGDGNPCNGTLFCDQAHKDKDGATVPTCKLNTASVIECDESGDNTCFINVCAASKGKCANAVKDGAACDDGDACTAGDVCKTGQCTAGAEDICCKNNADCVSADDGDLCNGTWFCNKAAKKCQLNPATVVTCPTVDNTACVWTACAPKTGKCTQVLADDKGPGDLDNKTCDADESACTPNDEGMRPVQRQGPMHAGAVLP